MTAANLTDVALDPISILQIGFVNPAQYYFEFYLNTEYVTNPRHPSTALLSFVFLTISGIDAAR
ncbi:hypothetical protein BIW11_07679 [Tropilaelaps mercedesae]|uniref:Uncharacterized protein n=1 Tax=Tropilaelaps mercedesae TaxID=418985 RepID=A0A1V9XSY0_9ACAR|nr:hypothetical protein BIW11_07679 [Tropilaelaps mercedesae]